MNAMLAWFLSPLRRIAPQDATASPSTAS